MVQIARISRIKHETYNVESASEIFKEATKTLKKASENHDMLLYSKAISLYYESITHYSNFTDSYIALAYISWKMNEYEKSIELIKSALAIEPNNIKAKKLLDDISYEFKNNQISKVISKHSNNALDSSSGTLKPKVNISQNLSNNKNNYNPTNKASITSSNSILSKLAEAKKNIKIVASNSFLDKLNKV
ncbi:MAG: hypothetical protein U0354_01100 [Candidatus Sericytochromatia bacterium]